MMVHTLEGIWAYIRPKVLAMVGSGGGGTVTIRKNSGADVGTRPRLNLIEGSNITLTVLDDAGGNEVDITIAAAGAAVAATQAIVDLPYPASRFHRVTVVDGAVGAGSRILLSLAGVPDTNTNVGDDVDMLSMQAVPQAGQFQFQAAFLTPIAGPLTINYVVG
jgi:hypothetical protein